MEVQTLQVQKYLGCNIYIRHFIGTAYFEYLLILDGQLYTANIIATKAFFQKEYKKEELEGAVRLLISMAQATVDTILESSKKSKNTEKILSPLQMKK